MPGLWARVWGGVSLSMLTMLSVCSASDNSSQIAYETPRESSAQGDDGIHSLLLWALGVSPFKTFEFSNSVYTVKRLRGMS